jgi:hypothetical protein
LRFGSRMEIKTADHALAPAKEAHKDRNVIERCYCRLKDFRRIATRYDKLARNYFSALCLVAVRTIRIDFIVSNLLVFAEAETAKPPAEIHGRALTWLDGIVQSAACPAGRRYSPEQRDRGSLRSIGPVRKPGE